MHPHLRGAVRTRLIAALLLAAAAAAASAQGVYKCAGPRATPVYQDEPCPPGTGLRDFQTDPATVSIVPMQPAPGATTRVTAPRPMVSSKRAPSAKEKPERTTDPAERRHIQPGMGEGEVLARLGTPDLQSAGKGRREARWTYMPAAGDPQTVTTVRFEYGKVVDVERKVVR